MKSLLLLDDDHSQLEHLASVLETDFKVTKCKNALDAWSSFSSHNYDGCIIDVHMPIINGIEFIQKIRQTNTESTCAFFLLSSDTSTVTKVESLKLGVKDFLWPDMSKEELTVRIKNNLSTSKYSNHTFKSYKDLNLDLIKLSAHVKSEKLDLTLIEFKILYQLVSNPNQLMARDHFKKLIWSDALVMDKTLNTHLTNLRIKINQSQVEIKSVKNVGIILS